MRPHHLSLIAVAILVGCASRTITVPVTQVQTQPEPPRPAAAWTAVPPASKTPFLAELPPSPLAAPSPTPARTVKAMSTAATTVGPPGTATMTWDYDTNSITTDLTFYLLSAPDPLVPLYKWQVVAALPAKSIPYTLVITSNPTMTFYTVIASNYLGVSTNSNAITPNAQAVKVYITH